MGIPPMQHSHHNYRDGLVQQRVWLHVASCRFVHDCRVHHAVSPKISKIRAAAGADLGGSWRSKDPLPNHIEEAKGMV